ncbi:rhodanese-like domain-containing protein [Aquipseudomonas guryensis]|jgi:rhodanese-related sulfurtransferase|uniref:Rhodanese-like domain-containing protein n=1 Tax=Aquipseudomonas guryensis TaxID=2759165 RepID=A0A7W4DBW0_9GAMM|nr:rhodanese-like domain-containing protein [Pseudomonas guryensis]MBB1519696.1 rhodanese-like domain-containing protein [Pseudomonas guryensis]
MSLISQHPAASSAIALMHFSQRLSFETDCSDVHASQQDGDVDYVLVDVRGEAAYASGHVPGAINIPHRLMEREYMARYPRDTLFVVYCAGPHCNGVHRAAVRLASLGYAVKEMLGGVTGWLDEGLSLVGARGEQTANSQPGIRCAC